MEKTKETKKSQGITLIALVITIIVLLILAGVSIATLTGNNGILTQAGEAKEKTIIGKEKEQIGTAYNAAIANKLGESEITASELQTELDKIVGNGKTTVSGGTALKISFIDTDNIYTISKNKEIEEYKKAAVTPVYAYLCDTDGNGEGETLVLSSTDTIEGYTIIKSYGDSEAYESNEDNAEKANGTVYHYPLWKDDKDIIINTVVYNKIVPTITERWFNCSKLTDIRNIENLDTSNVTNMMCMFLNCSSITNLNLSSFDTSSVKDMISMFYGCTNLTNLNVNNFNTSKVQMMNSMFSECSSLTSLNLSNFRNNSVEDMSYMFYNCINLTNIDFTNYDTSNVKNINSMFGNCKKLASLDLKSFDTSKVENMGYTFYNCSGLTNLDLSNFNTSNVKVMSYMFLGCTNLINLDISDFDLNDVYSTYSMFEKCSQLKTIYVGSKWVFKDNCNGQNMFKDCTNLVGGAGTTYDSSNVGLEYAHIDGGTSNPGYLTAK